MKTLKQLREECAANDCRVYRRKGRWFIYEGGTFAYWGHEEGARGCLSERAALEQALRAIRGNEREANRV